MRARWAAVLVVLTMAGCVIPRYGIEKKKAPGAAGGPAVPPSGGSAGAMGAGGSAAAVGGSAGAAGSTPTACGAEQKLCDGACVDLSDPKYGCTASSCNASACPVDEGATLACENDVCVVGGCGAGKKKCDAKCVGVDDPTYGCGETSCDATSCPDPQQGTLVCNGNTCEVGTCGTDTKECDHKCVPLDRNNGCGDTATCASCAAIEICDGSPVSKCRCVSTVDEACQGAACGEVTNKCGAKVECGNTCGDPHADQCADNACVECNLPADCHSTDNVCAKTKCTNHVCELSTVPNGTACPGGGTCSTKDVGICKRPVVSDTTSDIDATEVTVGAYELFLKAKAGDMSGQISACSWNTTYVPNVFIWSPRVNDYDLPINNVNWCDAYEYCDWASRRLCGKNGGGSMALADTGKLAQSQWMRFCRGPNGTKVYPYGASYDANKCNGPPNATGIVPVASMSQCEGGYPGIYDMSGNVFEWADGCDLNGVMTDSCVINGGSWYESGVAGSPEWFMNCDNHSALQRFYANDILGFRCCGP